MTLESSQPVFIEQAQHQEARLSIQAKLLARQVQRSPIFVFVVACAVVYVIYPYTDGWLAYSWLAAVVLGLGLRFVYAKRVTSAGLSAPPRQVLRNLTWFAFLNGTAIGISAPMFFFFEMADTDRAVVSLVLVGVSAGGISTSAAYAPVFAAYVLPALLPMAISWAVLGQVQHILLCVLVLLLIIILYSFVLENQKFLNESIGIRFQQEQLVIELNAKHEELLRAMEHAEQAKERAEEAGQAKARVLAAASHDLRQPLHALSLYSAVLSQRPEPQTLKEVSRQIDLSVRALSALLNALLDISQLDAGVYQIEQSSFNVHEVLERIVDEFAPIAQRKGLGLLLDSHPALTYSDPVVMGRIARNLIDNALKYTERGAVLVSLTVEGARIVITVRDSGKGIPKNEQRRVFEEFYQLDNPSRDREMGLGLGLSIVKRLAELIGSKVSLVSALGEGSCFSWYLPLERRGNPLIAREQFDDGKVFSMTKQLQVLVIEDEAAIRHGMALLLGAWGMAAHVCADLKEAMALMQEHDMDLIMADLRLEGGVCGLDVVNALLKEFKIVPVLLISGETDPQKLKDVAVSGFPLMSKPIQPEMLRKNIAQMLEQWTHMQV